MMNGICSVCGCTDENPCPGGCIWANSTATLCSRCIDQHNPLVDVSGLYEHEVDDLLDDLVPEVPLVFE